VIITVITEQWPFTAVVSRIVLQFHRQALSSHNSIPHSWHIQCK